MTGYGKAEAVLETGKLTIEIKTLNGKGSDASVKTQLLPKDKELVVRQMIADSLVRGTIDFFMTWEPVSGGAKRINPDMVKEYFNQMKDIRNNGAADIKVEKGTAIQLGVPADYPTEMVEAIREYAKGNSSIEAVWLKLMVQNNEQSYLLVVDSTGDRKAVWKGIADAAMPHRRNGLFIDFVPLDDSFGKQAATGEPIYRRRHGLFDGLLDGLFG